MAESWRDERREEPGSGREGGSGSTREGGREGEKAGDTQRDIKAVAVKKKKRAYNEKATEMGREMVKSNEKQR